MGDRSISSEPPVCSYQNYKQAVLVTAKKFRITCTLKFLTDFEKLVSCKLYSMANKNSIYFGFQQVRSSLKGGGIGTRLGRYLRALLQPQLLDRRLLGSYSNILLPLGSIALLLKQCVRCIHALKYTT